MVAPSGGGGATAIGPAISEESETAAPVSKQEQQMLRVSRLHLHLSTAGLNDFVVYCSFRYQILRMSYQGSFSIFTCRVKGCLNYRYSKFSYR